MALREFEEVTYLPLLSVRPAELRALGELPNRDKDALLPLFQLRPWGASANLDSSLSKIEDVYGTRPAVFDLCPAERVPTPRPVHEELRQLRLPDNGYDNWCSFIENRRSFIPAVQLAELEHLVDQVRRFDTLGRGMVVPFQRLGFPNARAVARAIANATDRGEGVLFVLDYGRQTREFLERQAEALGLLQGLMDEAPHASFSISASSFPESFGTTTGQDIYERLLFDGVARRFDRRLTYSDRGSARAERQQGGGGAPLPRIDYAGSRQWSFYRSDTAGDRPDDYRDQARILISEGPWDPNLRIWGNQMIERTAAGDRTAIISPARSTAARINIHLHQQLFYNDPDGLYDTDEEWSEDL